MTTYIRIDMRGMIIARSAKPLECAHVPFVPPRSERLFLLIRKTSSPQDFHIQATVVDERIQAIDNCRVLLRSYCNGRLCLPDSARIVRCRRAGECNRRMGASDKELNRHYPRPTRYRPEFFLRHC